MDILRLNKITNQVEFIVENLLFVPEFAALYKRDKSHKKSNSSKEMWCV